MFSLNQFKKLLKLSRNYFFQIFCLVINKLYNLKSNREVIALHFSKINFRTVTFWPYSFFNANIFSIHFWLTPLLLKIKSLFMKHPLKKMKYKRKFFFFMRAFFNSYKIKKQAIRILSRQLKKDQIFQVVR